MDRDRFSGPAHLDHVFCSPLCLPKVDQLIDVMDPAQGARVLDLGCSKAGFLARLVVRAEIQGVRVDQSL